jgi:NAD(P)-dependent dehydrogenase (short-subunit alcohol dehydrogenase family)
MVHARAAHTAFHASGRLYQVNVKGVFHCLQAGVKKMLADGRGGAIVNLASIASLIGLADRFAHASSGPKRPALRAPLEPWPLATQVSLLGGLRLRMHAHAGLAPHAGNSRRLLVLHRYSMTKGAVLTMTYSVATDYCKRGIRCNCVCPGRVHTPFVDGYLKKSYPGREAAMFQKLSEYQPIGRMGRPEEIAHLILYLCSDEASFCTGAAYPIDGGVQCRM